MTGGESGMKPVQAKKHLGQHFLDDEHVVRRVVEAISPRPEDVIVEIGPGLGALTAPVLERGARLDAVEIDPALAERLRQRFAGCDKFTLHCRDALDFDFAGAGGSERLRVIGNLPYNVSTPLLMRLFNACERIRDAHLMLQTEVAVRLAAAPGTRNYSRLSVAAACFTEVQHLFDVAPSAFSPPPQVSSSLVRLSPRPCPLDARRRRAFFGLVKQAFSQRRKTIGRIFSGVLDAADFARLGLNAAARPETLGLKDFLAVLNLLESKRTATMEDKRP